MKKKNLLAGIIITSFLTLGSAIALNSAKENFLVSKLEGSSQDYKIVLDKNNYATYEEVGKFNDSSSETNNGDRYTALGNAINFEFCSGNGITNNDYPNIPQKFCQMPGSQYGWVTNKTAITGIKKIKITTQQTNATFRLDFSNNHTLDDYYYSVTKPAYVTFRTEDYTGSTSYEINVSGDYNYVRLQNLGVTLSLVSFEIDYSCSGPSYRGVLRKNTTPITVIPYTVSEGGELTVDYKYVDPVSDVNNGVSIFLGTDETNCFGNYKIFHNRLETTYSGVTFSSLADGYNRIVFDISKLNTIRSGCVAPTTIDKIIFRWFEAEQGVYFDVKQDKPEKTTEFKMSGSNFVIANFTDIHVDKESLLADTGTTGKTIKFGIQNSNPDILVFSGDLVGSASDFDYLIPYLDSFKIPYFFILGNHDHAGSLGYDLFEERLSMSKYGYIEKGPDDLGSEGNYTVKIRNSQDELVHSLILMDTKDKYTITDYSNVEYFTGTKVNGVKYGTFGGNTTYCDGTSGAGNVWDGIRGNQITWFTNTANALDCETTLICHAGFNEYVKAYEKYKDAVNKKDQAKIDACAPIGNCNMGEQCCGTVENTGLFSAIKAAGTKNVICGHDHENDFSLLYEGVRLTYALKTGEGSYWKEDGTVCGYTKLTIDSAGATSLDQVYFNPLS